MVAVRWRALTASVPSVADGIRVQEYSCSLLVLSSLGTSMKMMSTGSSVG